MKARNLVAVSNDVGEKDGRELSASAWAIATPGGNIILDARYPDSGPVRGYVTTAAQGAAAGAVAGLSRNP